MQAPPLGQPHGWQSLSVPFEYVERDYKHDNLGKEGLRKVILFPCKNFYFKCFGEI